MSRFADGALRSPLSGRVLHADGPHTLAAEGERWPVIDSIPFLRVGRAVLAAAAVELLDRGDVRGATALLLADRDDWAPGPPPSPAACRAVAADPPAMTLRDAMAALAFGPVADYLAHRWSDPTFLSGLALAEAYWRAGARVFELCCGTGPFLRAFAPHAAEVTGGDVVFSKLWLARRFVAPDARLVCFDAAHEWPVAPGSADLAFCHDAFYFLPDKPAIAGRLRALAPVVMVGHTHNALAANHSSGAPLAPADYAELFSGAALFDDAELTAALLQRRAPVRATVAALEAADAISLAIGDEPPGVITGRFDRAPAGTALRRNPLYSDGPDGQERRFPSPRYEAEYAALVTYPPRVHVPAEAIADGADSDLVRARVLLDLPARW